MTPTNASFPTDKRQGFCFRNMIAGVCSSRDLTALARTTKIDCCCTMGKLQEWKLAEVVEWHNKYSEFMIHLGAAWQASTRSLCEPCPKPGSKAYSEACMETGYDAAGQDIDEVIHSFRKHWVLEHLPKKFFCSARYCRIYVDMVLALTPSARTAACVTKVNFSWR